MDYIPRSVCDAGLGVAYIMRNYSMRTYVYSAPAVAGRAELADEENLCKYTQVSSNGVVACIRRLRSPWYGHYNSKSQHMDQCCLLIKAQTMTSTAQLHT